MTEIQNISLLCIVVTAVLFDLKLGKIPNGVIVTGLMWGFFYQFFSLGGMGPVLFLGGCCFPILLLGILYYFRMIGAGDIKLLSVVGGFLGPHGCFSCTVSAILFGGAISLAIMIRRHMIGQRLLYFSKYIMDYSREKQWKSYLSGVGEDARLNFSFPVLLAVLCYMGGIF